MGNHLRIRWQLITLFLVSLLLCLAWEPLAASGTQWRWRTPGNSQVTTHASGLDLQTSQPSRPLLALASDPSADQLVQQGVDRYRSGDYRGAIALWSTALEQYLKTNNTESQAVVLENLALAYQQLGQSERAIAYWEKVVPIYRRMAGAVDSAPTTSSERTALTRLGRALIEQAQVYSRIGQSKRAIALLCRDVLTEPSRSKFTRVEDPATCASESAIRIALRLNDRGLSAAALGSLGNAFRMTGNTNRAIDLFNRSLDAARAIDHKGYQGAALNGLGNAYLNLATANYRRAEFAKQRKDNDAVRDLTRRANKDDRIALAYFQEGRLLAQSQQDRVGELRSLLSTIPVYYRTNQPSVAETHLQQSVALVSQLPDSRERVYAAIDLAQLLQIESDGRLPTKNQCQATPVPAQVEPLLQQAVEVARRLEDPRAASFALGELGHLYECRQQFDQAIKLTEEARLAADQNLEARDSLYLWEWQSGRIYRKRQQKQQAIEAYQRSVKTLESIRGDILTAARDVQFDFRDTVNPIYRDLVALQLDQQESPAQAKSATAQPIRGNFDTVLKTIDSLKLAELQDYFGNECVVIRPNQSGTNPDLDQTTAVFNTFILEDRTAIILSLPNGVEKFQWIPASRQELLNQVNQFRAGLVAYRRREGYDLTMARQLYQELIEPFAADLKQANIKTLVFVQDGIFRTVPMAALHDGQRYLIEQYAIASTPSLSLTDARLLSRDNLRVLALGLTQPVTIDNLQFAGLRSVETELTQITEIIPGSLKLIDESFSRESLAQALSRTIYPIIHIATHGKFGTDAADTFIVTGDRQKLSFNELDVLIRSVARNPEPLELLVLTACETAQGDDRSALGLAGVAVQAGAKSAIASLWKVDDVATATLASDFYANLRNPGTSRAAALQAAQVKLLKTTREDGRDFRHPGFWSALVLVGNWR